MKHMSDRLSYRRSCASGFAIAALAALLAVGAPAAALAQSSQVQELVNRIERLQQELSTLQGYVYRGRQGPAPVTSTGSGGADASGPVAAQLSVRITQLENEIRRLTGQNEEFGHAIRQMQTRLDKLVGDVDTRLAALERRAGIGSGDASAAAGAMPGEGAAPQAAPAARPPAATGAGDGRPAPGSQVLGTLRVDPATGQPIPGSATQAPRPVAPQRPQAAPAPETPEQMYDRAQTLLLKDQNVGEAEKVLRAFLEAHPKHALAANAHYWLGRTYFVREDYQQAARTFGGALQQFPNGDKAPDTWLNLGMSLARLGKTKEACTAYQAVQQNFPKAEDRIKRQLATERQKAKCG